MEEREALQREIEELQNRIKEHKRVHGDAPSNTAQWFSSGNVLSRGQGHNSHYSRSYSHQTQPYPTSHWRKAYSLNNKTRVPEQGACQLNMSKTQVKSVETDFRPSNLASVSDGTMEDCSKDSTVACSNVTGRDLPLESNRVPAACRNKTVLKPIKAKTEAGVESSIELVKSNQLDIYEKEKKLKSTSKATFDTSGFGIPTSFIPSTERTRAFNKKETSALPQMKTHLQSCISTSRTASKDSATSPHESNVRLNADSTAAQVQAASSPHKSSRFTWVKSQGTENSQPKSETCQSSSAVSALTVSPVTKQTNASNKKLHRRLSLGASKTSKYSWVSYSCSATTASKAACVKLPQKLLSPKASKVPGKMPKGGLEGTKILTSTPLTARRAKVGGVATTSQGSHASRYRWKAVTTSFPVAVAGSTLKSSRKGSVYRWTAQTEGKNSGLLFSRVQPSPSSLLSTGFKLRSRTKIIRSFSSRDVQRTQSLCNPDQDSSTPEKRSSGSMVTVRSRYSLRRRTYIPVRSPSGVRRGQSRALVALGRHKLRRLSTSPTAPWNPRTGSSYLSVRSPASQRVIKTRYKIDTRRAHTQYLSPTFSYRVKKIQSARILLQSRLRTTPERHWKGRDMRWINGALYRVSANKLSRTHTTSTLSHRSGKFYGAQEVLPCVSGRTSSTQHVASRVVQRSLAIIRHAQQKKQQAKQYCMYYNRFGKCNRGTACPYIHDPDKVAVCTRFLRGTCKQTDGTCPFSHKVSKEKMPVCSYFLKGICNNSSCPYSHVYVSRKAAVCQDFVRGYCPQGEKCKKKHTLVCPDFSSTGVCPKGSKCKLQHRQKAKQGLSSGPTKKARAREAPKRDESESTQAEESTPSAGPAKLPSFISLSSSPETLESTESPPCPPVAGPQNTGRKFHIKPRFLSHT